MGTHPIFESDFDCLTEKCSRVNYYCKLYMMEETITASSRRWAIIFIFAAYSLTSAFQWIEFAIVPAVFQEYYGIEYSAITWTSQIYMAVFIPLVFPATWLIE